MNFSRRRATTARPVITRSIWQETRTLFLHSIVNACLKYNIPDQLIINVDQTPSKYVASGKVTMAEKNSKHVPKFGSGDKRQITATYGETLDGDILPLQLIYKGKTKRSLPKMQNSVEKFPAGFLLSQNEKHWSNEQETLQYIEKVLNPYLVKTKEELGLPQDQKSCLIWDAFSGQGTDAVRSKLKAMHIEETLVPSNMTHLLQPLDLTTNGVIKKMESKAFSNYFTKVITDAMLNNPDVDVTTIKVDLKLSTLKPKHAETIISIYKYFQTEEGKNIILSGWKAAGITEALQAARNSSTVPSLNPYQ